MVKTTQNNRATNRILLSILIVKSLLTLTDGNEQLTLIEQRIL